MLRKVIGRIVLVSILCYFPCCADEESVILLVNGTQQHQGVFYAFDKNTITIECQPSVIANVTLRQGDKVVYSKECKTKQCAAVQTTTNTSANFSCGYIIDKKPEVIAASVAVFVSEISMWQPGDPLTGWRIGNYGNTSINLTCPTNKLVTPDGKSTVAWYRNILAVVSARQFKIDEEGRLIIEPRSGNPIDDHRFGGVYMCKRFDNGSLTVVSLTQINSDPWVSSSSKSYNKMEGDPVTLSCDVEGYPLPTVTWARKDDKPLPWDRLTFGKNKNNIVNSTMTFKKLHKDDYGEYVCIGTSEDEKARAQAVVLLRVRETLAALWPFLGIVAEVVLLVAIIFIYERRRAKKERLENDEAADQKKSLTASNNENKELRQRKA